LKNNNSKTFSQTHIPCPLTLVLKTVLTNAMIFATYCPAGTAYPIGKMSMIKYWDDIEPIFYLTLFAWLAPIKEGKSILQDFAAKADAPFAQPTYLAYVILTPVKTTVGHLIDICFIADVIPK
jgi:hypothetical protein